MKEKKLKTIRQQIATVENFCDKMNVIAKDESDNESLSTVLSEIKSTISEKEESKKYLEKSNERLLKSK